MPKFEARMAADGETLELLMYGPIGSDWWGDGGTVDAKAVAKSLQAHKSAKTIRLQMNSIGGDPFHAIAIYSALKSHGAKVTATIDGLVASAATLITCAADVIEINEAGLYMIHEAAWGTYGTVAEQQSIIDATKRINEQSAAIYAARSGQTLANVQAMMAATTWMTAQEAKEKGFVTSTKPLKTMSASVRPGLFVNVPDHIKPILAKLQSEEPEMNVNPNQPPAAPVVPAATAPATPAPAPAPAVPVAQPVAMTAVEATQRASAITSACVLAGKPELASKYIDDPAETAQGVQAKLFSMVCSERAPAANGGEAAGETKPANPNTKFESEFDAAADVYAQMGLSKEQYVKSRRVDEGLDKLSLVPAKS